MRQRLRYASGACRSFLYRATTRCWKVRRSSTMSRASTSRSGFASSSLPCRRRSPCQGPSERLLLLLREIRVYLLEIGDQTFDIPVLPAHQGSKLASEHIRLADAEDHDIEDQKPVP